MASQQAADKMVLVLQLANRFHLIPQYDEKLPHQDGEAFLKADIAPRLNNMGITTILNHSSEGTAREAPRKTYFSEIQLD